MLFKTEDLNWNLEPFCEIHTHLPETPIPMSKSYNIFVLFSLYYCFLYMKDNIESSTDIQ